MSSLTLKARVVAAGGGWYGWRCQPCQQVSDAIYTSREAAKASLDGHLTQHHPNVRRLRRRGLTRGGSAA